MLKKVSTITAMFMLAVFALPATVLAHVTVKPSEVATAARQVFTVSVPNESETADVVGVRLVIPEGVKSARPNAKQGWKIDIKKEGEGEAARVTEISWISTGATVPVNLREEFLFQAQAPAEETELKWKAYETYSDGTVVGWDQTPKEGDDANKPYSVTKVVKNSGQPAAAESKEDEKAHDDAEQRANIALGVAILGLLVGAAAFARPSTARTVTKK